MYKTRYLNKYNTNLLNIKDIQIKKIERIENKVFFYIETPIKEQICPCCGEKTSSVHDYRHQKIKDISPPHEEHILILKNDVIVAKNVIKDFMKLMIFYQKVYIELHV